MLLCIFMAVKTDRISQRRMNLTLKQTKAISYLLTTKNKAEAAKRAGISRDTLYRWLRDPNFVGEIEKQKEKLLERLLEAMGQVIKEAFLPAAFIVKKGIVDGIDPGKPEDLKTFERAADFMGSLYRVEARLKLAKQRNELLEKVLHALDKMSKK